MVFVWFVNERLAGSLSSSTVLSIQCIISAYYHRELLNDIMCWDLCATQFIKKMNLKDMFYLSAKAWDQVISKLLITAGAMHQKHKPLEPVRIIQIHNLVWFATNSSLGNLKEQKVTDFFQVSLIQIVK